MNRTHSRPRNPLLRALLAFSLLALTPAIFSQTKGDSPAVGPEDGRPHLQHSSSKLSDYGLPKDSPGNHVSAVVPSVGEPLAAPGLRLPNAGLLWALDDFQGKPNLTRLHYQIVKLNNHVTSNILKGEAMPFIYHPKSTVEVAGSAAAVRIHNPSVVFFAREDLLMGQADEAEDAGTKEKMEGHFLLLRLHSKSGRRTVTTVTYNQFGGHPSKSEDAIPTIMTAIPGTGWIRIVPEKPLTDGEYGFTLVPAQRNVFSMTVYDFAIDERAPENSGTLAADPGSKP